MGVVLLTAAGFCAMATDSVWAGLFGLLLALVYNVWAWRRVELWPIDPASSKTALKVGWAASLFTWLAVFFQ